MELRDLISFYEIAKSKSFSTAAERLFCSQSTISIRVRNLETELGVSLLERGPKGVRLSPEGEILFPYAEQVLSLIHQSKQDLVNWSVSKRGKIHIGASHYVSCYQLPAILRNFKTRHALVDVHICIGTSYDVISMVQNTEVQIGISRGPLDAPNLEAVKIFEEPVVLCIYPEHYLAGHSSIDLRDLQEVPLIGFRESNYRNYISDAFREVEAEPCIAMALNHMEAMKKMVTETVGISLLPISVVEKESREGILKIIPISNPPTLSRATYIYYKRDRKLSGCLKTFMEAIHDTFSSGPLGQD